MIRPTEKDDNDGETKMHKCKKAAAENATVIFFKMSKNYQKSQNSHASCFLRYLNPFFKEYTNQQANERK